METSTSPFRSSLNASRSRRACDGCKVRKVKCDLASPKCSSCLSVNINCTFVVPVRKRGPKPRLIREPLDDSLQSEGSARAVTEHAPSSPFGVNTSQSRSVCPEVSPRSPHLPSSCNLEFDILKIGKELLSDLGFSNDVKLLEDLLLRCSTAFFEQLYPLEPLVYQPAFELKCRHICQSLEQQLQQTPTTTINLTAMEETIDPIDFAVVTAVCAKTVLLLPSRKQPEEAGWRDHIYRASRKAIILFADYYLENPCSGSIVARYIQSGYLHHIGKTSASWRLLGEAIREAEVMNLHQKQAYEETLDPWERELRCRLFWILYTADRSAACLMRRLSSFCVNEAHEIEVPFPTEDFGPFSDKSNVGPTSPAEMTVSPIIGFNLNVQLWHQADLLFREIEYLRYRCTVGKIKLEAQDYSRIRKLHVAFETCLDSAPATFQHPAVCRGASPKVGVGVESSMIAVQFTNIHTSFQCLRMKCLYALTELHHANGSNCPWTLFDTSLHKIELAREMLHIVHSVSVESLKINGESCAEKIRVAGAALLDVINEHSDQALIERANTHLATFIHILTSLDSKAVDSLAVTTGAT